MSEQVIRLCSLAWEEEKGELLFLHVYATQLLSNCHMHRYSEFERRQFFMVESVFYAIVLRSQVVPDVLLDTRPLVVPLDTKASNIGRWLCGILHLQGS